jgi:macrolide-specific efflux system membrane fusion protein
MAYLSFLRDVAAYVRSFAKVHPATSGVIALAILVVGYYAYGAFFPSSPTTTYTLGSVSRGTIVSTVSGSGQVSTSNKIDLKAKASGEIVWIGVKAGDLVRQYQGLIGLDSTDAKKAVIDAEQSLAEAKLQYQRDSAAARDLRQETSLQKMRHRSP